MLDGKSKLWVQKGKEAELNESYQRILRWFFDFPNREISLSDLSVQTGTSKRVASRVVRRLEKEGFLFLKEFGRVWLISSNPAHPYYKINKIPINLDAILRLGIPEKVRTLIPHARAIVLFGSFRTGEDNEDSDIDIAVEVPELVEIAIEPFQIPKLGYRKNIKLNLHLFNRNKIDINLFNNISNGIVLDGFLEVRP